MLLPIHAHLAREMDSRLSLLRHDPQHIIIHGADAGHSRQLLSTRYPKAQISEVDARADALTQSQAAHKIGWLDKLSGKKIIQKQQDWQTPLPEAQADMLWANLTLLPQPDLLGCLKNWAHGLQTNGLLFFTHFGRDSLPEIRALLQQNGIACTAPHLLDMHDLADMLHGNGFYDPVTDTAQLVLDYATPETLWQDLQDWHAWQVLAPDNFNTAQDIVRQAVFSGSLKTLTLETVFGHAIKKLMLPENEQLVQFVPRKK